MRRQMNQAPMLIKLLVVLSLLLITTQIILLTCRCKCGHETQQERSFERIRRVHDSLECNVDDYARLKRENANLKRKIVTYEKLKSVVLSQDFDSILMKGDKEFDALRGYTPKNEYDVIPFQTFDAEHFYGKTSSLSGNPIEAPLGQRGLDHSSVIKFAVKTINDDSESKGDPVTPFHLIEGITRNDGVHGSVYDLYFRSSMSDIFKRIEVFRPFGPLQSSGRVQTIDTSKTLINVIVPLSGRLDKFSDFMKRFVDSGIRMDRRVFLTLVYFGAEGRDDVRAIMNNIELKENFKEYKVIFTSQEFSRGAALQKGAEIWEQGNVLLFFCDVDVYFRADFLERCRMHSAPGKKVYYPIVFSQYNPIITYGGEEVPSLENQVRLSKDTGFWRDFGFGMSCQYRDDFLKVGGFDLTIKGWGMEDVKLYRNYLASKLTVVRAYDRGLFHIYHKKQCQRNLADNQFVSCLQSKAVSEGSHKQMGMLAFGQHIVGDTDPDWANMLKFSLSAAAAPEPMPKQQEIDTRKTQLFTNDPKRVDTPSAMEESPGGQVNSSYQKYIAETLFDSAVELKQILDYLSKQEVGSKIVSELDRMRKLQLMIFSMSQGIVGSRQR